MSGRSLKKDAKQSHGGVTALHEIKEVTRLDLRNEEPKRVSSPCNMRVRLSIFSESEIEWCTQLQVEHIDHLPRLVEGW